MLSESRLGFGLMRLPRNEEGSIDQAQVNAMADRFLEAGFTYFDTAYAYAGSEEAIRKALVERYPREAFTLADKLPAWKLNEPGDPARIFQESLDRAGVDFFDYYLLHSIEEKHLPTYEKYDTFSFLKQMKEAGKIRHIGFSYHDGPELLEAILKDHPELEFVQLQLNYIDWENPVIQARRNYEVARRHGKPVVVMEPVKGGTLAQIVPEAQAEFEKVRPGASPASWALRFIAEKPGIMTVLSGMSTPEQMQENTQTLRELEPLGKAEQAAIQKVSEILLDAPTIPCTGCSYCPPGCPMQIQIPRLFTAYNTEKLYGSGPRSRTWYQKYAKDAPASACIGCGQCEGVCPQSLPIAELLRDVAAVFD